MSILSTNLATQVYPNRYYIDTSELVECVDLPVSPYAVDKLTPEGQYRPLKVLMYVDVATPETPAARIPVAYFDKVLPGYLIDVTDIVRSYIVDLETPVQIAVGFSVVIDVNETLYEVPTKAAIVKQAVADEITNVDFVDMAAITDPDPLAFVTETSPFLTTTYHTTTGILIPDVANDGGVFRLLRVIDPVFSDNTQVEDNIIVIDDSTESGTSPVAIARTGGSFSFQIKTTLGLDISILSITAPSGDTVENTFPFTVNATPVTVNCTGYVSGDFVITHTGINTPFTVSATIFS